MRDDKGTLAVNEKGFWLIAVGGCEGQQLHASYELGLPAGKKKNLNVIVNLQDLKPELRTAEV